MGKRDTKEELMNVKIYPSTAERLKKHGVFGESWDALLNRIADKLEGKKDE